MTDTKAAESNEQVLARALLELWQELRPQDCDEWLDEARGLAKSVLEGSAMIPPSERPENVEPQFDLIAHLQRQREWSARTFGPGHRTQGIIDHIGKELLEIEADPLDLKEWVDVILLALDGAWRAGHSSLSIAQGIAAKQAKNEQRQWPDWRTADPNKAIEHSPSERVAHRTTETVTDDTKPVIPDELTPLTAEHVTYLSRRSVIERIRQITAHWFQAEKGCGGDPVFVESEHRTLLTGIDHLIAAVRQEHRTTETVADDIEQARNRMRDYIRKLTGELDEAAARERDAEIAALIAAVRTETLAEYTLTDSDVDKFLAACEEPVDPARVDRIRKLFNEKRNLNDPPRV